MKARQSKFVKGLIAACILLPLVLFGAIAVYADYVGPQHRSKTTYTSQRKKCYLRGQFIGIHLLYDALHRAIFRLHDRRRRVLQR